jgi:hypothetical protein
MKRQLTDSLHRSLESLPTPVQHLPSDLEAMKLRVTQLRIPPNVPQFRGTLDRSVQDPFTILTQFEAQIIATNTPDIHRPKLLSGCFANVEDTTWWLRHLNKISGAWKDARRFFLSHFVHPNAQQHRFDQLITFAQWSNESMH